jgi:hypothetical protein
MRAERHFEPVDRRIATLAGRQWGMVSRAQLAAVGLGRRAIGHRLEIGRLHLVHRSVYAVGHRPRSKESRWMAAVLAVDGAVLSHRSAAALWELRSLTNARIEVTVDRQRRNRAEIVVHRGRLPDDERTARRGIPVTTVPRTLLDLAAVARPGELEHALNEAEVRRLMDVLSVEDLLNRHPRRPGAPLLRRILAAGRVGSTVTRSELEERFLAFVDRVGLPRPTANASLELRGQWIEVDCLWRAQRLIVELDGHAVHATRRSFERDRSRDRVLMTAGMRVVRITWHQLNSEQQRVERDLRILLGLA